MYIFDNRGALFEPKTSLGIELWKKPSETKHIDTEM